MSVTGLGVGQIRDLIYAKCKSQENPLFPYSLDTISVTKRIDFRKILPSLKETGNIYIYNLNPDIDLESLGRTSEEVSNFIKENLFLSLMNEDYVSAVFTVGDNDLVFMIVDVNGKPHFVMNALYVISMVVDQDSLLEMIDKSLVFLDEHRRKYFSESCSEEMLKDILGMILAKVGRGRSDLFKGNISKISTVFHEQLRNIFGLSKDSDANVVTYKLLSMGNSVYREVLLRTIENTKKEISNAYRRGLTISSLFTDALKMAGYKAEDWNIFVKKVDICPTLCLYKGKLYKYNPPDSSRYRYRIKRFIFDRGDINSEKFIIRIKGKHPNVDERNDTVCLGDLEHTFRYLVFEKKKLSVDDFVNFLTEIEKSLAIINFDSAFHTPEKLSSYITEAGIADGKEVKVKKPKTILRRV